MIEQLKEGYDWKCAFEYAGEPGDDGSADIREAPPGSDVSLQPFSREDVIKIIGISKGENDELNWLCAGKLKDGRWFFLSAGCDSTGWDCQAGGQAIVTKTKKELLRYGISKEEKARIGL